MPKKVRKIEWLVVLLLIFFSSLTLRFYCIYIYIYVYIYIFFFVQHISSVAWDIMTYPHEKVWPSMTQSISLPDSSGACMLLDF